MAEQAESPSYTFLIATLSASLMMILGFAVFLSWYVDSWLYEMVLHYAADMRPGAIAGLAMAGLSLWLQRMPVKATASRFRHLQRALARALALLVIMLGLSALLLEFFGATSAFRNVLIAWRLNPEVLGAIAMKPLNAFCLLLAGESLLLLDSPNRKGRYWAEYFAVGMACLMWIPLLGHLYSATATAELAPFSIVSIQAPVFFIVLATGILAARPDHSMMAIFFSNAPGGHLLRRLLPTTLVLLIGLDLIVEWGARREMYAQDKVSPLVTIADIVVLLVLFWRAAGLLNHEAEIRRKGEIELARNIAWLKIVSDNTTDAIFVKDHDGRFVFANPAALTIMGKERADAIGRTSMEVFANSSDAAAMIANDQYVMRCGKAQAFEQTIHLPGGVRTFHSTKSPWINKEGVILGIIGISSDITERKNVEDAIRAHEIQLEALVAERTAEVRELIAHIEATREEEKRAIARELHDDLGSALTALNMHLAIIFQKFSADPYLTERIVQVKALLNSVTATTRRIQNGLRPDKLDIFGIKTAIAELAADFENYTGVPCRTDLPDEELSYGPQLEITLFRMVQETLNNIAKHAKATHVDVILDDNENYVTLTIRDDGIGIASGRVSNSTTHGLRGMRERASYFGGRIDITGEPGKGTKITVTLPKKKADRSAGEILEPTAQPKITLVPNADYLSSVARKNQ